MADKEDFTTQEYESIIEELIKENKALKKRIIELEDRDQAFKVKQELKKEAPTTIIEASKPLIEVPTPIIEKETIEPVILEEEPFEKEEIQPIEHQKEIVISGSIFSQEVAPLEMSKGQILQGVSRRECPKCGNKNKTLIRETIDKTHLISDYPRMYGKKYHCGDCGVEWRVPLEM